MEKLTLSSVFEGRIFNIPDYQRGYAWEEKQLKDFVQDIDAMIEDEIKNHYTGTIVTYQSKEMIPVKYGAKTLKKVDIVDGQQRITTSVIYLSVIIKELINLGNNEFQEEISNYLYRDSLCKLIVNNGASDFFLDVLKNGKSNTAPDTLHKYRIIEAYNYFVKHISKIKEEKESYLIKLFEAITNRLHFTYYSIEEECEIGMTFELMNSRGKELSILELLKNYLMYWTSKNGTTDEREDMTRTINKSWKEIYTNISKSDGNEDQLLRIVWTLLCSHIPKNWKGYDGFKDDSVIPIRNFEKKSKEETKIFILKFVEKLAGLSKVYSSILNANGTAKEEEILSKIINAGSVANFLPLMVVAKDKFENGEITEDSYLKLLSKINVFSYRVFLFEAKRSNTGMSQFFRWANLLIENKSDIEEITKWINNTIHWYSPEDKFQSEVKRKQNWYIKRRMLKYTLFEFELYLLKKEGKNQKSRLNWGDLSDSTIEHILPQTVDKNSEWDKLWSKSEIDEYRHDISNLVLTVNNSNYLNFDFDRKKGKSGEGYCFANSDIRQERKIASYSKWTVESCNNRREELEEWIIKSWGNSPKPTEDIIENEVENEEGLDE